MFCAKWAVFSDPVTNVLLSWEFPGGTTVNYYLVHIKNTDEQIANNMIVDGNSLSLVLDKLLPITSYEVIMQSVNNNGLSVFSPSIWFTTASK